MHGPWRLEEEWKRLHFLPDGNSSLPVFQWMQCRKAFWFLGTVVQSEMFLLELSCFDQRHTSSVLVRAQKNGCLTPLSQMTFCFETLQKTAQDMSCQEQAA